MRWAPGLAALLGVDAAPLAVRLPFDLTVCDAEWVNVAAMLAFASIWLAQLPRSGDYSLAIFYVAPAVDDAADADGGGGDVPLRATASTSTTAPCAPVPRAVDGMSRFALSDRSVAALSDETRLRLAMAHSLRDARRPEACSTLK